MESSTSSMRSIDIPKLNDDIEKKVFRIFCLLRQYDTKARLKTKQAEFQTAFIKCNHTFPIETVPFKPSTLEKKEELSIQEPTTEKEQVQMEERKVVEHLALGQGHLVTERNAEGHCCIVGILGEEIEELRKSILKDTDPSGFITVSDLKAALSAMKRPTSKANIQWMIWEIDNDADGCISWDEFRGAYARVVVDKLGLEPSQLFHVIQFLLCDRDRSHSASAYEMRNELKKIIPLKQLGENLWEKYCQSERKLSLSDYLEMAYEELPIGNFNVTTSTQQLLLI